MKNNRKKIAGIAILCMVISFVAVLGFSGKYIDDISDVLASLGVIMLTPEEQEELDNIASQMLFPDGDEEIDLDIDLSGQATAAAIGELFRGSGTALEPFIVSNLDDFITFRNLIASGELLTGMYFCQTENIVYDREEALPGLVGYSSNGNVEQKFAGVYDGMGHYIENIKIEGEPECSIFGMIPAGGVIRNLGIKGGTINIPTGNDTATMVRSLHGNIENCYSTATLTTGSRRAIAGIAGNMKDNSIINNCIFAGDIIDDTAGVKICALGNAESKYPNVSILNSFYDSDKFASPTNSDYTGIVSNVTGCSTENLKSDDVLVALNTIANSNSTYVNWTRDEETGYPVLVPKTLSSSLGLEGNGTQEDPYVLSTIDDLDRFRELMNLGYSFRNEYVVLANNISYPEDTYLEGFPKTVFFRGIFDGRGHYIENVNIVGRDVAFFGKLEDATVMNLGMKGGSRQIAAGGAILARNTQRSNIINFWSDTTLDLVSASSTGLVVSYYDEEGIIANHVYFGEVTPNKARYAALNLQQSNTAFNLENLFYVGQILAVNNNSSASYSYMSSNLQNDAEYIRSEAALDELNRFASEDERLKSWVIDEETGYPILSTNDSDTDVLEIKNLAVAGKDQVNKVDSINWYKKNGEYYLLLPNYIDRNNITVELNIKDTQVVEVYDMSDNLLSSDIEDYTDDIFTEDRLKLVVKNRQQLEEKEKVYILNIMQSDIASIHVMLDGSTEGVTPAQALQIINGDSAHDTGFKGSAVIYDENGKSTTQAIKKMKGRGNHTWTLPKRPYQIKFDSKFSMLGMNKSKTWLFLAGYNDGAQARNYNWLTLAQDIGVEYAVECKPVDFYVNNNYMGSYLVTSKVEVDSKRVDIADDEYLMEIDNTVDDYQFNTTRGYAVTVKNPDLEEYEDQNEAQEVVNAAAALINNIEDLIYDENVTFEELSEHLDLESFAKFYWVEEMAENYDMMVGSCYMYLKDGIIHMGPVWDMDNTLNRSYFVANTNEYYTLNNTAVNNRMRINWYRELMKRQEFSDLIDRVFLDNYDLIVTETPIKIQNYANEIRLSGLMNQIVWDYSKLGTAAYVGANFDQGSQIFLNSYNARANFYANEYNNLKIKYFKWSLTDQSGNRQSGTVTPNGHDVEISLPPRVADDATITITAYLDDGTTRDFTLVNSQGQTIPELVLENGGFNGTLRVSNPVTLTEYKTENANVYNFNILPFEVEMIGIEVQKKPTKTEYFVGDIIDMEGCKINAVFNNDLRENLEGYTYKTEPLTLDDALFTITYGEFTTTMRLTINEVEPIGIEVRKNPDKTEYSEGESFIPNGMEVYMVYNNGKSERVEAYTYSTEPLTQNDTEFTIYYDDFNTTIDLVINEVSVTGIEIRHLPTKTDYYVGDVFNPEGLEVYKILSNGEEELIEDYTYKTEPLTIEDTQVAISYGGFSEWVDLDITPVEIVDIEVESLPETIKYKVGEVFDPEGLVINAVKNNGTREVITDYTYNTNPLTEDDTRVEIKYGNFTVYIDLEIVTKIGIMIESAPTNTEYKVGDKVNLEGLKVVLVYSDDSTEEITDYEVESEDIIAGQESIVIKYGDYSIEQPIEVDNTYSFEDSNVVYDGTQNSLNFVMEKGANILDKVYVNDVEIASSNYTVDVESSVLLLKNTYLDTLEEGTYNLKVTFTNGCEAQTQFEVGAIVASAEQLPIPTLVSSKYNYTGSLVTAEVSNFDSNLMKITGNTGTNMGVYQIRISLLDKVNYQWEDRTTNDIVLSWRIVNPDILLGDMDLNGVINGTDASIVLDKYNKNNATPDDVLRGDMDGNGVLNGTDASMILDLYNRGL